MADKQPASAMIRVPTPLVEAVKELARLHRQGQTQAVLEGVQELIAAIDRQANQGLVDRDAIAALTARVERLELANGLADRDAIAALMARVERLELAVRQAAPSLNSLPVQRPAALPIDPSDYTYEDFEDEPDEILTDFLER